MRFGPPRGETASHGLTITSDLAAPVVPGVAPLCTAPALLDAAEGVARELLDPHLESGEVATVVAVDVTLRSPLPVGVEVELTATVASVTSTKLVCEVLARRDGAIVARGSVEHQVVDAEHYTAAITAAAPTVAG